MAKQRNVGLLGAVMALAVALASCGGSEEGGAPAAGFSGPRQMKVNLLLNWFPESQHGGYYTALINGYFAAEGLDVTIQPGGPQVPVVQRVGAGQVEFGITNADQLVFGRAAGAPVVALMAPLQDSPRCLMFHAESGIRSFADIRNVTLAMNSNDAFAAHLLRNYTFENVNVVRYTGNIAAFLADKRHGQQAYSFSEPFIARSRGAEPVVLMLRDAGYNPYTSMLFTTEARLANQADVVERMVRASMRGWRVYMESPEKTNQYLLQLNPELGAEALAAGWELMKPLVYTEDVGPEELGSMTEARWAALIDSMEATGQVDSGRVRPAECFSTLSITIENGTSE